MTIGVPRRFRRTTSLPRGSSTSWRDATNPHPRLHAYLMTFNKAAFDSYRSKL